ncbi:MAG: hypothetical protein AB1724_00725 [Thermodesulfobacteriota bacterium]
MKEASVEGNTLLPLPYVDLTRGLTAAMIATGGLMHAAGLYGAVRDNQPVFWWVWIFFLFAIPGYLLAAVALINNRLPGFIIALGAPPVGGFFILIGFLWPETELLRLIPGTYGHEIRLIGFVTLICEPIAAVLAGQLLLAKMLTSPPGLANDKGSGVKAIP